MKLFIISGARPQFIKLSPILQNLNDTNEIDYYHLHTGQHYDSYMSEVFFKELDLNAPDINLQVKSTKHGEQTSKMISGIEEILLQEKPDAVLVPGDTNSTLAGGISASKLQIPVIHLESGLRSYDYRMPEEINRRLTDHLSRMLITTSQTATTNLLKEGIEESWIFQTGDTMVDAILRNSERAESISSILEDINLKRKEYLLLTLHRQENVDFKDRLESILTSLNQIEEKVVFPIHPRTKKMVDKFNFQSYLNNENIITIEPVGYLDFIKLEKHAQIILTDSGGIQKEALTLEVPCLTLRDNTEWIETIEMGVNKLVGAEENLIVNGINDIISNISKYDKMNWINPYGDGLSSEKIVEEILHRYNNGKLSISRNIML
ncbi:MAG: non-hydrolyzing UDP-N-acetylglucosamine 2-epimerase [Candidatus Thorarchaeota archaeon]